MSRQTLWERRQDDGFRNLLRTTFDQDQTLELRRAISRHLDLASMGSTASLQTLAKLKELGQF